MAQEQIHAIHTLSIDAPFRLCRFVNSCGKSELQILPILSPINFGEFCAASGTKDFKLRERDNIATDMALIIRSSKHSMPDAFARVILASEASYSSAHNYGKDLQNTIHKAISDYKIPPVLHLYYIKRSKLFPGAYHFAGISDYIAEFLTRQNMRFNLDPLYVTRPNCFVKITPNSVTVTAEINSHC